MHHDDPQHPAIVSRRAGTAFLAVALMASAWLVVGHAFALPGCGAGSGCATLNASRWSRVPLLGWPISTVGLAWFSGLLAGWLTRPGGWMRWAARAGAFASLALIGVMAFLRGWCPWCATAHVGSLGFWIISERARGARPLTRGARAAAAACAATGLGAWGVIAAGASARAADAERALAESERRITEAREPEPARFTGRYRWGPADARARIVVFTDYQCPDCRRIEGEIESAFEADPTGVSVSVKHFPFCADCNRHVPNTPHPNACWAARAAEAGGMLAGDEGFHRVHRWLFARGGAFTTAELRDALPGLGFEPATFEAAMASDETRARLAADADEAVTLGIHFTPMVFVNGVEVRGWNAPGAIARAVSAAQERPSNASDVPPAAIEKAIEDWRQQPVRGLAPMSADRAWGEPSAGARVIIFGDYQEPFTARADAIARSLAGAEVAYEFRHFPVDPACNPAAPRAMHPLACESAALVESARTPELRRAAHEALMNLAGVPDEAGLEAIRARLGIEDDASAGGRIRRDADEAKRLGLASLPMIFVNDRLVPRFMIGDGEEVLSRIIDQARGEPGGPR